MKRKLIIGFILLCITSVNVFALGSFIYQQKNHHHEFCALLAHNHHHMHHDVTHAHGHSHKVNLIDFYTECALNVPLYEI